MPRVSAIVSTYNAEKWIRGRILNLVDQTLYQRGDLEIIVVNAGSKQGEAAILRDLMAQGVQMKVITSLREPIYVSWNRGIKLATGHYVTNANTDDRLRPDALEVMADELDRSPYHDVVYADSYVTDTVNAKWDSFHRYRADPYSHGKLQWREYDPLFLATYCFIGPCPMWRKALHREHGYFDDSYQLAGDYEFWLRLAARGVNMKHINDTLSLFYYGGSTIQNQEFSDAEAHRALQRWKPKILAANPS